MSTQSDYEWYLKADLSRFEGEWVSIHEKKVIAHSKDLKNIIEAKGLKAFIKKGVRV